MAEAGTTQEIKQLFGAGAAKDLDPEVQTELQSLCRIHLISPQEAFWKWESYSMASGAEDLKLSAETARAFKKDLQDRMDRENREKAQAQAQARAGAERRQNVTSTPRNAPAGGDLFERYIGLYALLSIKQLIRSIVFYLIHLDQGLLRHPQDGNSHFLLQNRNRMASPITIHQTVVSRLLRSSERWILMDWAHLRPSHSE
jgi:hypothetical protein